MANHISPLAYVDPTAKLGDNITIHPFAAIDANVEIGDGCVIYPHTSIVSGTVMGSGNIVYSGATIGATPQSFRYAGGRQQVRIGNNNCFRENVVIAGSLDETSATIIGNDNAIMDGVHICHDVRIGNNCVIGIHAEIAGECELEDNIIISSAAILQHLVRVGRNSVVQSGCRVQKDVPPYIIIGGNPASYNGVNAELMQKFDHTDERTLRHVANAYRIVYSGNEALEDALQKITEQIPSSAETDNIVAFIRNSKRGIVRRIKND